EALGRPVTTGELAASNLYRIAGEQRSIEEGPEPGDKEHQLGSDEHHHAVAQVQGHHTRVMAFMGFLKRVAPPCVHDVEHDQQADREYPVLRLCEVKAQQLERVAVHRAHPGDAAECHQERTNASQEGPRARIDDVIVVILGMGASHYPPILFLAAGACTSAVALVSGW